MMEELRDAISKELDNLDTQLSQRMKLVISVRPDDLSTAVDLSCLSVVQQVLTVVIVIQNSVTTLLLDSISLYHLSNLCIWCFIMNKWYISKDFNMAEPSCSRSLCKHWLLVIMKP